MSKVSVIGSLTCQEGRAAEMTVVLKNMVEAARAEPGVEVYSYHQGPDNKFWFFALMWDAESMKKHGQSKAMQDVMAAFGPLTDGPPQMTMTTPVAAIGLDL